MTISRSADLARSVATGAVARRPRWHGILPYLLTAPVLAYMAAALALPMLVQIYFSFMSRERGELGYYIVHRATLDNYLRVFTRAELANSLAWSILISLVIACGTILLSLPVAHFLARGRGVGKLLVEMSLLLPLFGDIYFAFALMYAFAPQGIVNWALMGLGLIRQPLPLTTGPLGAVIAMMLPSLAVLLVRSAIARVDPIYEEAALTLGAHPLHAWFATTFLLARTGVTGAFLLTFAGGVGAFTIPLVLAGTRNPWVTTRINETLGLGNVPLVSALSVVLGLIASLTIYIYFRITDPRSEGQRYVG